MNSLVLGTFVGLTITAYAQIGRKAADKNGTPTTSHDQPQAVKVVGIPRVTVDSVKDRLDIALLCISGIVAVVAITQLHYLIRATNAAAAGADAAMHSADAAWLSAQAVMNAERPWVLVKRIGNPQSWYDPTMPSYFPGMVLEFNVYGKTPARVLNADFKLHPVPAKPGVIPPEPDLPAIPDYRSGSRNPEIPKGGRVLPPDESFTIRLRLDPPTLTEEQWLKLRDSETIMCAYGFIEYKDAFNRGGNTCLCYVYDFAWGGVITSTDGTVLNPPGFRLGGPSAYHETT